MTWRVYGLCLMGAVVVGIASTALLVRWQTDFDRAASAIHVTELLAGEVQRAHLKVADLEAQAISNPKPVPVAGLVCVDQGVIWQARPDGTCQDVDRPR